VSGDRNYITAQPNLENWSLRDFCVLVVEPTPSEKIEDDDTDVDEPVTQVTDDGEKMAADGEAKSQDEPVTGVDISNKETSETTTAVIEDETQKDDTDEKAKVVESQTEKADGEDDKEKKETKEVVVIEDEEEEDPEPEDEVVEDRDDGGEDPSEVEIEKFNVPMEQALLAGTWQRSTCDKLLQLSWVTSRKLCATYKSSAVKTKMPVGVLLKRCN